MWIVQVGAFIWVQLFVQWGLFAQAEATRFDARVVNALTNDLARLNAQVDVLRLAQLDSVSYVTHFYEGLRSVSQMLDSLNSTGKKSGSEHLIERSFDLVSSGTWRHDMAILPNVMSDEPISSFYIEMLDRFSGPWFGHWNGKKVRHFWLRSEMWKPPVITEDSSLMVIAHQSVFTGDGFGWNYLILKNDKPYVAGYVCHFSDDGEVFLRRPHLGSVVANGLVWVTREHVFFEFVCTVHHWLPKHYVIFSVPRKDAMTKASISEVVHEVYYSEFRWPYGFPTLSHLAE